MSQAGRKRLSNSGIEIFLGVLGLLTGGTVRRKATSAFKSSSAMPLYEVYGCTGTMRSPLGRLPSRMAVMICSSVQPPMPVLMSGVILLEYTVPKGASYFLPPAFAGPFATVWQPQPPVAPKIYFPRAISSGVAAKAGAAKSSRSSTAQPARVAMALLQTPHHTSRLPALTAAGACRRRRRSPAPRSRAPRGPRPPPA